MRTDKIRVMYIRAETQVVDNATQEYFEAVQEPLNANILGHTSKVIEYVTETREGGEVIVAKLNVLSMEEIVKLKHMINDATGIMEKFVAWYQQHEEVLHPCELTVQEMIAWLDKYTQEVEESVKG